MIGWLVSAWVASSMTTVAVQPSPPPQTVQQRPITRPPLTTIPQVMQQRATGFDAYKSVLAARAAREGVRTATIQAYVPTVRFVSRAVELDRSPQNFTPGPSIAPFAPYRARH